MIQMVVPAVFLLIATLRAYASWNGDAPRGARAPDGSSRAAPPAPDGAGPASARASRAEVTLRARTDRRAG